MDNKKIIVPAVITRDWLAGVFAPLESERARESGDIFAAAKARMDMVRDGLFSIADMERVQRAREVFRAEDDRRAEIAEGRKKTAEKLAFLENAMKKAIPDIIETTKKWDARTFDKRFLDALAATENVWAHKPYRDGLEIVYAHGPHRSTLAYFHRLSDILDEEEGKKPRINASKIVNALELKQEHLANYIGNVKRTESEIDSIRELIFKAIRLRKELQRYDRDTLAAYSLDYYGLKDLGI